MRARKQLLTHKLISDALELEYPHSKIKTLESNLNSLAKALHTAKINLTDPVSFNELWNSDINLNEIYLLPFPNSKVGYFYEVNTINELRKAYKLKKQKDCEENNREYVEDEKEKNFIQCPITRNTLSPTKKLCQVGGNRVNTQIYNDRKSQIRILEAWVKQLTGKIEQLKKISLIPRESKKELAKKVEKTSGIYSSLFRLNPGERYFFSTLRSGTSKNTETAKKKLLPANSHNRPRPK